MDYSIRPLCFSHVDLPREFFGGVPIHSGEGVSASPMVYVLLTGRDEAGTRHHYLVDAGFHADKWIHRFGFYDWEPPETVLGKVGVRPEEIEKIFLTHMHFDHANNVGAFPNADVYVQLDEWPSGYTNGSSYNMLMTYGQIYEYLKGEVNRIVPGHDTLLFERHPSWKVGPNEVCEVHVADWDYSLNPAASDQRSA